MRFLFNFATPLNRYINIMQAVNFEITEYSDNYKQQILTIWEKSVLATHDFLTPNDFMEIKELVNTINFNDFQVFCLVNGKVISGFIGVAEKKVEMLFLDPEYFGQGLGQKLLNFAVKVLNANKVDVNERSEERRVGIVWRNWKSRAG